jgi:hypothetical protein
MFFLTGSFVYFMAGVFRTYSGVSLFLILTDTPLTRLLFQLEGNELQTFWLGGFEFNLLEAETEADLFIRTLQKAMSVYKSPSLVLTYPGLRVSSVVSTSFTLFGTILNHHITNDTLSRSYYLTLPMAPLLYYFTNIIGQVRMVGRITVDVPCAFPSFAMPQGNRPIVSYLTHAPVMFVSSTT